MKKLVAILVFLHSFNLTNAQWNLNGNAGTNSGSNYVGTTDNNGLSFGTFGVLKMHLAVSGELGLGTTTPA